MEVIATERGGRGGGGGNKEREGRGRRGEKQSHKVSTDPSPDQAKLPNSVSHSREEERLHHPVRLQHSKRDVCPTKQFVSFLLPLPLQEGDDCMSVEQVHHVAEEG